MSAGTIEIALGALCILGGFVLVVRGVGGENSGTTIKVLGIEFEAKSVGPGVIFATMGVLLIVVGANAASGLTGSASTGAAAELRSASPAGTPPMVPSSAGSSVIARTGAALTKKPSKAAELDPSTRTQRHLEQNVTLPALRTADKSGEERVVAAGPPKAESVLPTSPAATPAAVLADPFGTVNLTLPMSDHLDIRSPLGNEEGGQIKISKVMEALSGPEVHVVFEFASPQSLEDGYSRAAAKKSHLAALTWACAQSDIRMMIKHGDTINITTVVVGGETFNTSAKGCP